MPQAQADALTDQELLAIFKDDRADLSLLSPEEQNRLVALTDEKEPARDPTGDVPFLPDWVNDAGKAWVKSGPTRVKEGLKDAVSGNVSRGLHDVVMGTATTALPMLAPRIGKAVIKSPVATLTKVAAGTTGGVIGGAVTRGAASALGADEDQAVLAGDAGAFLGGAAAVKAADVAGHIAARIASSVPVGTRGRVAGEVAKGVAADMFPRTARAVRRGTAALDKAQAEATPTSVEPVPAASPVASTPAARRLDPAAGTGKSAASSTAAPAPPIRQLPGETLSLPAASRSAGQMSPAAIGNDLGLSARRLGVTLEEQGFAEAADLVRTQGLSPVQAVAEVAARAPKVSTPVATPSSRRVSRAEAQEYARLMAAGKTDEEAARAILAQRQLSAKTGATTPAKAARRVKARQTTGRWPEGTP